MLKEFYKKLTGSPAITAAPEDHSLDYAAAVALFDELSALPKIRHDYLRDGCYERSVVMCHEMIRSGYAPMQAWIFNDRSDLFMTAPNGNQIQWWFHVAPALKIKMNSGEDESLIFDPAMYDGPVRIEEWCQPIIVKHTAATRVLLAKPDKHPRAYHEKTLVNIEEAWPERLKEAYDRLGSLGFSMKEHQVFQSALRQSFNPAAQKTTTRKANVKTLAFKGNHKRIKPKPIYLDKV